MNRSYVIIASILICLSIILGAFGAHGLKDVVETDALEIFDKGVKYQMYTGLALLAIGLSADKFQFDLKWFFRLLLIGVIIFSGMLYLLTFKQYNESLKICGAIVPIGGTLMIISWGILLFKLIRTK